MLKLDGAASAGGDGGSGSILRNQPLLLAAQLQDGDGLQQRRRRRRGQVSSRRAPPPVLRTPTGGREAPEGRRGGQVRLLPVGPVVVRVEVSALAVAAAVGCCGGGRGQRGHREGRGWTAVAVAGGGISSIHLRCQLQFQVLSTLNFDRQMSSSSVRTFWQRLPFIVLLPFLSSNNLSLLLCFHIFPERVLSSVHRPNFFLPLPLSLYS